MAGTFNLISCWLYWVYLTRLTKGMNNWTRRDVNKVPNLTKRNLSKPKQTQSCYNATVSVCCLCVDVHTASVAHTYTQGAQFKFSSHPSPTPPLLQHLTYSLFISHLSSHSIHTTSPRSSLLLSLNTPSRFSPSVIGFYFKAAICVCLLCLCLTPPFPGLSLPLSLFLAYILFSTTLVLPPGVCPATTWCPLPA